MTDRADEIAREWDGDEKLARIIRAYGDERANAALKSMNKVVDDERSARLERNPSLRRECRNAALEEAKIACMKLEGDFGNEHDELCDCVTLVEDECNCHLSEFRKAVDALKEKPLTQDTNQRRSK